LNIKTIKKEMDKLKHLLSLPSVDVCRSSYDSADEAIAELELLETGVINQDENAISRLLFLLLPTSDLQEISISSGWGTEFLNIAEVLEKELGK